MTQIDMKTITTILSRNFCPLENGINIKSNEIQSDFSTVAQSEIIAHMLSEGYLIEAGGLIRLDSKGEELLVDLCV